MALIRDDDDGMDNRPDGAVWSSYQSTDENGQAVKTFTVSMQPGNNYRAAATCLQDAPDQAGQAGADALSVKGDPETGYAPNGAWRGYKLPVVWSKMLTVWRKLHVETDSMVRPTFTQNTFTMAWNEPGEGAVPTQVVFDVDDPPGDGAQTDDQQFTGGYVELQDPAGAPIIIARTVDYTTHEGFVLDDAVTINISDCGGGQSGLACLGGVTEGTAILSDDELSVEVTFGAKIWGCDDLYAGGGTGLAPPDLSAMELRYHPAYIEPVHETTVSGIGGLAVFLRNVDFDVNDGKVLWDQILPVRDLSVSTSGYWTVTVVAAWQPEEPEDADPDTEDQVGTGVTKGICTHRGTLLSPNDTQTYSAIGPAYTGLCTVFKAVFGESSFTDYEKYTVVHEIGHTFGLDHSDGGAMCARGDCQREPFTAESLKKLRDYVQP